MKHQWNTGRAYDKHGQRMVAEVTDNAIAFSDLSRGIHGSVPLGKYLRGCAIDKYSIERLVMCNYDYGNYSGSNTLLTWNEGESK